jgi:hypothetical protein
MKLRKQTREALAKHASQQSDFYMHKACQITLQLIAYAIIKFDILMSWSFWEQGNKHNHVEFGKGEKLRSV